MRTTWVWVLLIAATTLVLGYALGQREATDATCIQCEQPVALSDRTAIHEGCLAEYAAERIEEGRQMALADIGEGER